MVEGKGAVDAVVKRGDDENKRTHKDHYTAKHDRRERKVADADVVEGKHMKIEGRMRRDGGTDPNDPKEEEEGKAREGHLSFKGGEPSRVPGAPRRDGDLEFIG